MGSLCYIEAMETGSALWGLVRYRRVPCPTWKGLLLILIAFVGLCYAGSVWMYQFLSPTDPRGEGILVVEGWVPDDAVRKASERFRDGRYSLLVTTGVPIEIGNYLSEHHSTAEVAAATLRALGVGADSVVSAPARGEIARDRTLASALAFGEWLRSSQPRARSVDVVTMDLHARRTRMLFQSVLGDSVQVGVIAVPEAHYGPDSWWQTSEGVKTFLSETLGYLYAAAGVTTSFRKK